MSKAKEKQKDALGNRMKKYEECYKQKTIPKSPIILRVDGKSFHTFTKEFKKPFDELLMDCMQKTMIALCEDIQNAKFGYTQSDEITIVSYINDFIKSSDYLDGKVNKIISLTASKATKYFNKFYFENVEKLKNNPNAFKEVVDVKIYEKKLFSAEFDCRVMNIPEKDIYNNLIWRQNDASKNSVSMYAYAYFSHKEVENKSNSEKQEMLFQKGINWNNIDVAKKRGSCCYRISKGNRNPWYLDLNMPILTSDEAREKFKELLWAKD